MKWGDREKDAIKIIPHPNHFVHRRYNKSRAFLLGVLRGKTGWK